MSQYVMYPSSAFLQSLYSSLCSTMYAKSSTLQASIQSFIIYYLNNINETNYNNMIEAINFWITSTTIPQLSVGIATGTPANVIIQGLRILVIEPDGVVSYDSTSSNNYFKNLKIPRSDFLTSGKFLINESHGTRPYFQAAMLTSAGTFFMKKYSNSVKNNQIYLATRQGLSPNEPFGVVVISMNSALD